MKYLLVLLTVLNSVAWAQVPRGTNGSGNESCCPTLMTTASSDDENGSIILNYIDDESRHNFAYVATSNLWADTTTHGIISKINEYSDTLWTFQIPDPTIIRDIATFSNGDIVIVGAEYSAKPSGTPQIGKYAFIIKLSSQGELLGYRRFSVDGRDNNFLKEFTRVVVDKSPVEDIYVLGNDPRLVLVDTQPKFVDRLLAVKYSSDLSTRRWSRTYFVRDENRIPLHPKDLIIGGDERLWVIANRSKPDGPGIALQIYKSNGRRRYAKISEFSRFSLESIVNYGEHFIAVGKDRSYDFNKQRKNNVALIYLDQYMRLQKYALVPNVYPSVALDIRSYRSFNGYSGLHSAIVHRKNTSSYFILDFHEDLFLSNTDKQVKIRTIPSSKRQISDIASYDNGFYTDHIKPTPLNESIYRFGNMVEDECFSQETVINVTLERARMVPMSLNYANAMGDDALFDYNLSTNYFNGTFCDPNVFVDLEICPAAEPILTSRRFIINLDNCGLPTSGNYSVVVKNMLGIQLDSSVVILLGSEVAIDLSSTMIPAGRYFICIVDDNGDQITIAVEV